MNAVVNPLGPVYDALARLFPEPTPLSAEDRRRLAEADKEAEARDHARADFVAKRTPELVRQYHRDDGRVDDALQYAAGRVSVGMRLAFRNEDDAELGRLLRARMAVYLHDQASDAAEDEGYTLMPELPL
jgi:hypothetical protein